MPELEQKAEAKAAAKALAARMGDGWQPEMYRSLDYYWHPKAVSACGRIEVMPEGAQWYDGARWYAALFALMLDDRVFEGIGPTPEAAVENLRHNARQGVRKLIALLKVAGIELDVEDPK